jgi:hypothetical protein
MSSVSYSWDNGEFTLVHVEGTRGHPYTFGDTPQVLAINIRDFFIRSSGQF